MPHLNNIYATPPYLHDGRASSLDEIWTIYNPKDKHGLTNDLTKDQLNDLIEFLKTKTNRQKVFLKYDSLKHDQDDNLLCYLY